MIKSILNKITSIPYDKLLHFISGILVSMFFSLLFPMTKQFCFVFAVIAGVWKEVYDKFDYGKFDWLDILSTSLGGLLLQIWIWL